MSGPMSSTWRIKWNDYMWFVKEPEIFIQLCLWPHQPPLELSCRHEASSSFAIIQWPHVCGWALSHGKMQNVCLGYACVYIVHGH